PARICLNSLWQPACSSRAAGRYAMLRKVVCGVLMAVGAATAASAQDAKAKGEQVYAAQKCSLCHSIAGKGNSKGALDVVGSKMKPEEIRPWIVDAKGMTAKTKAPRK